jgi:hypothetical protein
VDGRIVYLQSVILYEETSIAVQRQVFQFVARDLSRKEILAKEGKA